jgi:PBSX family phage terminase large subunit
MEPKELSPKQRDFLLNSRARINIACGAVRSGKTVVSLLRWLYIVAMAPKDANLLMVAKTERTLRRNILDLIMEMVDPQDFKLNSGLGECKIYGHKVYLVGANDERAEQKIRGMSLYAAYLDEATLCPESFFQMLLSRLSDPNSILIATTNPDSPAHYIKKNFIDRAQEVSLKYWHFTLEDNTALDPGFIEAIKKQYVGLWYKRFILGEFVMAEGSVYDVPEDIFCVSKVPNSFDSFAIAVDYGITNPCHYLLAGRSDDIWYVLKEWRWDSTKEMRQKSDSELSKDLGTFMEWGGKEIIPDFLDIDPSATSFIVQTRQDYPDLDIGYAVNPVLEGIRTLATSLATGKIKIFRALCPVLMDEYSAYVWDPKKQLLGEDVPIKSMDHGLDALRYLTMRVMRYS